MLEGELNENKNTLRLIEAVKNVNNDKIKYLICGQGPLEEEYKKKIKEFNLESKVKLLGFRKDIPSILSCVDCFMMPSYREGLSKAMMEAMAYGLPVIASKIRGNIDLVGENEGGILVSPFETEAFSEAIELLSNDKELNERFQKRNLEFIQNFAEEKVLEQINTIVGEI